MSNGDIEEENQLKTLITVFKDNCSYARGGSAGVYYRTIGVHARLAKVTGFLKGMKGTREMGHRLNSKLAMIEKLHVVGIGDYSKDEVDQVAAKWMSIYNFVRHGKEDSLRTKWD
jgi:hypothetical protein